MLQSHKKEAGEIVAARKSQFRFRG